jgi:hypothetical protein
MPARRPISANSPGSLAPRPATAKRPKPPPAVRLRGGRNRRIADCLSQPSPQPAPLPNVAHAIDARRIWERNEPRECRFIPLIRRRFEHIVGVLRCRSMRTSFAIGSFGGNMACSSSSGLSF